MQGNPLISTILMYAAIGGIFYFILLRPQQKQRKMHDQTLRTLKKGDEILTAGGLIGEVLHIAQEMKEGNPVFSMDDRITIKSADTRLLIERSRVAKIFKKNATGKDQA